MIVQTLDNRVTLKNYWYDQLWSIDFVYDQSKSPPKSSSSSGGGGGASFFLGYSFFFGSYFFFSSLAGLAAGPADPAGADELPPSLVFP